MKRLTLAILVAAQCVSGHFAHAESPFPSPLHIDVHFADLDLSRIEGAEALYRRLRAAARQVCSPVDEPPLGRAHRFNTCVSNALSAAVARVDQPLLSTYYQAKVQGRGVVHPEVTARWAPTVR